MAEPPGLSAFVLALGAASLRQKRVEIGVTAGGRKDAYGHPLLRLTFNWTDNKRKLVRSVAEEALTKVATALGGAIQHVSC